MKIKGELGKDYNGKRSLMDFQLKERESELACARLIELPEWKLARRVMLYLAARDELDTVPLVKQLLADPSKEVYTPFITDTEKGIEVTRLTDFAHLAPGRFNILECRPQYRESFDPSTLDLIVVPGIVFDRRGGRIGYGHGYYDKFLKHLRATKVGLAYEFQILTEIPQSMDDIPMDLIVTASEVIRPIA